MAPTFTGPTLYLASGICHCGMRNDCICRVGLADQVCQVDLSAWDFFSLSYCLATSKSLAISAAAPAVLGCHSITRMRISGGSVSKNCSSSTISFISRPEVSDQHINLSLCINFKPAQNRGLHFLILAAVWWRCRGKCIESISSK